MLVGEVMIDADHPAVLISGALVGANQVPGSVPIVCSIRRREQIKELLHARINSDANTRVRSGVAAARLVTSGGQQALMGKRVGYRSNCCGCLYLAKALIVRKEEGAIM